MHMSSTCPRGCLPGLPGQYIREYKGMEWVLCFWVGWNSRHCFRINELGWGNSQHCWIMGANHEDITGLFLMRQTWLGDFLQPLREFANFAPCILLYILHLCLMAKVTYPWFWFGSMPLSIRSLQMHGWHTCNQQLSSVSNCALIRKKQF